MKKILIVIGILLLSLNIQAQSPGIFSYVIVRDSLCMKNGGGDSCVTVIMNDTLVNTTWVRNLILSYDSVLHAQYSDTSNYSDTSGFAINSTSSPGGSSGEVQFNNAGSFGGITGFTWNGTTLAKTNITAFPFLSVGNGGTGKAFSVNNSSTGDAYYGSGSAGVVFKGAATGTGVIFQGNNSGSTHSLLLQKNGVNEVEIDTSGTVFKHPVDFEETISIGGGADIDTSMTLQDAVEATEFDSVYTGKLKFNDGTSQTTASNTAGSNGDIQINNAGSFGFATDLNISNIFISGSNAAFGDGAMSSLTIGAYNSAFNRSSLFDLTEGNGNTAYGAQSLPNTTLGSNNSGLGRSALYYNTTGNYNTGVGARSLLGGISGSYNIGLGAYSGEYSTSLSNRLFINSIDRLTFAGDTGLSIIHGVQAATTAGQRLDLNANVFAKESLNIADSTLIGKDSLFTKLKVVSKQYAGQLVVSTPLTLLLDVDDQFYTLTGLTSDIEENTTLTDSTITLGSESYGLYHFLITLTVEHTAINAEITCSIFLNDVETNATETQTVNGSGEPFGYSIQGLAWLSPGDVIKVRFASSNNGTLTINRGNYHVIRN